MYQSENQRKYLNKKKKEKIIITIIQIFIALSFIIAWELLTKFNIINSFIYSSPSKIIATIKELYLTHNLFNHIFTTIYEVIIAFMISITLGFIIALIFYEVPIIAKIFDPYLTVLNSLPKVALGPIIIILTGANYKSIILMSILINLIVNITTIYNGFLNTDKVKLKLFKIFKANKWQTLTKLIIPSSYSTIITSLKLNIALTLIGVITGEFLVSQKGIGYLIIYATGIFDLDLVMSGIIILLIISFILYKLVSSIETRLMKNSHM